MCDGFGALEDALERFTTLVDGHTCERERNLRELTAKRWPLLRQSLDAADLDFDQLFRQIEDASPDLVFLGGAPPCPPFSTTASQPRTFVDERSAPLHAFLRLRDGLAAYCRKKRLWFKWVFEEVASMSEGHRCEISAALGCKPVLFHAADFGYLHRPRLYWGFAEADLDPATAFQTPSVEVIPPGRLARGLHVLKWKGDPWPSAWTPTNGYHWKFRGQSGKKAAATPGAQYAPTYSQGRFLAFTTAWPHPADRPPQPGQNDEFVTQRFLDDGRLRPLAAYVKGNVLWKGDHARPLLPDECERLMGLPPGCTADLEPGPHWSLYQTRLHAIASAVHLPSMVVVLMLLLRSVPQLTGANTPVIRTAD